MGDPHRLHGGTQGSGGQHGNSNAFKHGLSTARIKSFRKAVKTAIYETMRLTNKFGNGRDTLL